MRITADTIGKRIVLATVVFLLAHMLEFRLCHADSAEVLPKGVARVSVFQKFYLPVDERFDEHGDTENPGEPLSGPLDSSVFPQLQALEQPVGPLPQGTANLGTTDVEFEYHFWEMRTSCQYGITERVTAGIEIPYMRVKNNVDAKLDTSNATVGKTAIGTGVGAPLAPLPGTGVPTFPDTVPLTEEDVQNLIGDGLDTNGDGTVDVDPGLRYDRVKNWSNQGIMDIRAGFRYQYFRTNDWRLAFTTGAKFPTGETNDPDNLQDWGLGLGYYSLLFGFQNDFTGIKNLVLNATFEYTLNLPDDKKMRVASPDQPITGTKDEVDRDVGDIIELEGSAAYEVFEGSAIFLLYKYGYKFKDSVSGDMSGVDYGLLEDETDYTEHIFIGGLSYSTIPLFRQKKFPLPMSIGLSYRTRFAGSGNLLKSEYIGLNLELFF